MAPGLRGFFGEESSCDGESTLLLGDAVQKLIYTYVYILHVHCTDQYQSKLSNISSRLAKY